MIMKSLGTVLLSAFLGGLTGSLFASLPFEIYEGGGTVYLASSDPDIVIIFIKAFLSGAYGFVTAVITLVLVNHNVLAQLNLRQVITLMASFGLIHSLIWTAFAYDNAISGLQPPILSDLDRKIILSTSVVEFVTGGLIGLISVAVVRVFNKPAIRDTQHSMKHR